MIVFGVTMFVMMLWVGGMAIDFMRFEYERARIAYTTDRAALAAASLNQPLADCEAVAKDYFDKAGLDTSRVIVKGSCNPLSKKVLVSAETSVKSLFLNLMGIKTITAGASSVAEEHTQDVEISLVLDISGSMSENTVDEEGNVITKMEALQGAAEQFFDLMLTSDNVGRVSINIVPYNMQVNAGPDIFAQLSASDEHDSSHCVDFIDEDFETVELTDATAGAAALGDIDLSFGLQASGEVVQRTGHFDRYWTTINHPNTTSDDNAARSWVCPISDWSTITLMSQNKAELIETINQFEPGGNTSIDIGVKWGSYFLNPSSNTLIAALPEGAQNFTKDGEDPVDIDGNPTYDSSGDVVEAPRRLPDAFANRPFAYDRDNTRKILVVMSDGKNTTQYMLNEDYASGESTVAWDDPDVSGNSPGSRWLSNYKVRSGPSNDWFMSRGNYYEDYFNGVPHEDNNTWLSWQEVWAMMGTKYFAYYYNYARDWDANAYWDTLDDIVGTVSSSTKNDRLEDACDAAKDPAGDESLPGVTIFSIGFEVSDSSAEVLENCATKEKNFFRVDGQKLNEAFISIAKTIQRLQLTN